MKAFAGPTRSEPLDNLFFCSRILAIAALVGALSVAQRTYANPWVPTGSTLVPAPSNLVPAPKLVTGKDFSDQRDRDALGAPDQEQVVAWDGSGGVRDSYDYTGTLPAPLGQSDPGVDGLAAPGDSLFHALRGNQASMLFSVEGDPNIMYVRETGLPNSPAGNGIWATPADIDAMNPVNDTDALEVWGLDPPGSDDSLRFSVLGDPPIAGGGKVAVWEFNAPGGPSAPHTLTTDLAASMDMQFGGPGAGGPYWSNLVELMDVDAVMAFGEQLTYSIRPLSFQVTVGGVVTNVNFDGGEIFEYDGPGIPTRYLKHGGYVWDTGLDVRGTFNVMSENVDALEAVAGIPEPSTFLLLMLGLFAVPRFARRGR
jgi:hypothetical protein